MEASRVTDSRNEEPLPPRVTQDGGRSLLEDDQRNEELKHAGRGMNTAVVFSSSDQSIYFRCSSIVASFLGPSLLSRVLRVAS
jgi:hypothetical protein